jgi:hypothetical protein
LEETKNLLEYSPEEIEELYTSGNLPASTVDYYIAKKTFREKGLLGLEPVDVETLYNRKELSDKNLDDYIMAKESPFLFGMQEGTKGIIRGGAKAVKEAHVLLNQTFYGLFRDDETIRKEVEAAWSEIIPDVIEKPLAEPSALWSANLVEGVTQFSVGMVGAGKVVDTVKLTNTLRNGQTLTKVAEKMPKLANWLARVGAESAKGAIVDYAVFNPTEGRLADLLEEHPSLGKAVPDFLLTNPDNPESLERLKGVLEGVLTAGALETALASFKALKTTLHMRTGSDPVQIKQILEEELGVGGMMHPLDDIEYLETIQRDFAPTQKTTGIYMKGDPDAPVGHQGGVSTPEAKKVFEKKAEELFYKLDADNIADRHDKLIEQMEAPDGVKNLLNGVRSMSDDVIEQYTRGVQKDSVTRANSIKEYDRLTGGRGIDEAKKAVGSLFKDTKYLNERIALVNQIIQAQAHKINKMLQKETLTFEEKTQVIEAMSDLIEIDNQVRGIRAEMGRGFRFSGFKEALQVDISKLDEGLKKTYNAEKALAEEAMDNVIKTYKRAKDDKVRFHVAKYGTTKANQNLKNFLECIQANLLWGSTTHVINLAGGTLAYTNETYKRFVGTGTQAIVKRDAKQALEIAAWFHGTKQGIKESFKLPGVNKKNFYQPKVLKEGFKKAWDMDSEAGSVWKALFSSRGQIDTLTDSKFMEGTQLISKDANKFKEVFGLEGKGFYKAVGDLLLKLPFHGLAATDELLKNIGTYSEIHSKAWREAVELTGGNLDEVKKVYYGSLQNVSKEKFYEGIQKGREITYTELAQHSSGRTLDKWLSTNPGLVARIVAMPFYKIILNISKYVGRQTPLGLLSGKIQRQLAAGGVERYEAIAGMLGGTAIIIWGASAYEDGELSGRTPEDIRETVNTFGGNEYSYKIGDKWVDYNRLDYVATLVGLGADLARAKDTFDRHYLDDETAGLVEDRLDEVMGAFMAVMTEPFINKTFAQGLMDTLEVFRNPERRDWGKYAARQGAKAIPFATLLSNTQKTLVDDFVREKETALHEIYSYFYLNGVPIKRHPLYGTPMEQTEKVFGLNTRQETDDIVVRAIMGLGMEIGKPTDVFRSNGVSIKLNREQWAKYNDFLSELPVKKVLENLIASPGFQAGKNSDFKIKLIRNQISAFRNIAKQRLLATDKELLEEYKRQINFNASAIMGETSKPTIAGKLQKYVKE